MRAFARVVPTAKGLKQCPCRPVLSGEGGQGKALIDKAWLGLSGVSGGFAIASRTRTRAVSSSLRAGTGYLFPWDIEKGWTKRTTVISCRNS